MTTTTEEDRKGNHAAESHPHAHHLPPPPQNLPHNLNHDFPHDAYPKTTELLSAIEAGRWDDVRARLETNNVSATTTTTPEHCYDPYVKPLYNNHDPPLPQIAQFGFADAGLGMPPLHRALMTLKTPHDVLLKLISHTPPDVFQMRDKFGIYGFLPLHWACQREEDHDGDGTRDEIVRSVMDRFPEAVWERSVERQTYPLHLLLEKRPTLELVQRICGVPPPCEPPPCEGLRDMVALPDEEEQYAAMVAIDYRASDDVVEYLMDRSRKAQLTERNAGFIPLQCAALHGCSIRVLQILLAEPGCIKTQSKEEVTPLHYLFFPELDEPAFDRWFYATVDDYNQPSTDLVAAHDMARIMIQAYCLHAETLMEPDHEKRDRKKARRNNNNALWLARAQKVIGERNMTGRWTVLQAAKGLQKELWNTKGASSVSLSNLITDLEGIMDGTFKKEDFQDGTRGWKNAWIRFQGDGEKG